MMFWILAAFVTALPLIMVLRPVLSLPGRSRPVLMLGAASVMALVPVGLYLWLGKPGLSGQPFDARLERIEAADPATLSLAELKHRITVHLRRNPDDSEGWAHLTTLHLMTGDAEEAVIAAERALERLGQRPDVMGRMGEALTARNNGVVDEDARGYFEAAFQANPSDIRSGFFLAVAAEQSGDKQAATARLNALKPRARTGGRWAMLIGQKLAELDPSAAKVPLPDAAARRSIEGLGASDQRQAIEGMVAGLEARLRAEGGEVAEWLRLTLSFDVLGEREKAAWALEQATTAAGDDAAKLAEIEAFTKARSLNR